VILDEHLPERAHAVAAAVLLGELAHGNLSEISLNGVGEEFLVWLRGGSRDRSQHDQPLQNSR
jgi:hypothetical protein